MRSARGPIFPPEQRLSNYDSGRGWNRSIGALHPDDPGAREHVRPRDGGGVLALRRTRQMFWRMLGATSPMEAHRLESRVMWTRGASADAREGTAFLEKRAPVWRDAVSNGFPACSPWFDPPAWQEGTQGTGGGEEGIK